MNYTGERNYSLQCHGCGLIHVKTAWFISSPVHLLGDDGIERGAAACPTCAGTPGRIAAAYRAVTATDRGAWQAFQAENWQKAA